MSSWNFNPDLEIFRQMAEIEDRHWWFVARRQILDRAIARLPLPENARILEAGCGTGGSLTMLARHGHLQAMDLTELAVELARERAIAEVRRGRLPDQIPFPDERFDLIVSLDVIQHVEDDIAAFKALKERLKPGGYLLVTVPAYAWLWSRHDESWQNLRRYSRKNLIRVARCAGLKVTYTSHFNTVLFPAIVLARVLQFSPAHHQTTDQSMPSPWLNRLLTSLFASERHLIGRVSLPYGVSLLLVARQVEG
jgi:SAM-dependent methyltransferase